VLGQPKFPNISNELIMSFSQVSIYSGSIPVKKTLIYIPAKLLYCQSGKIDVAEWQTSANYTINHQSELP
jgi:hypothetical protein